MSRPTGNRGKWLVITLVSAALIATLIALKTNRHALKREPTTAESVLRSFW